MLPEIQWDFEKIEQLFARGHGRCFARVKTPWGMRTRLKRELGRLEGRCFRNAMLLSLNSKGRLWYCEGYTWGWTKQDKKGRWMPHAWVSPTRFEEDWAVDPTWKWDGLDHRPYNGVRFEPEFAFKMYKELKQPYVDTNTVPKGGLTLLSHQKILEGQIEGLGKLYGF